MTNDTATPKVVSTGGPQFDSLRHEEDCSVVDGSDTREALRNLVLRAFSRQLLDAGETRTVARSSGTRRRGGRQLGREKPRRVIRHGGRAA